MPHRPQTQNGGITKPGRKSVIQIVTAWIVKIHLWFQRVTATQASNFSAGVWYCKVFLGRSLSWRAVALSSA